MRWLIVVFVQLLYEMQDVTIESCPSMYSGFIHGLVCALVPGKQGRVILVICTGYTSFVLRNAGMNASTYQDKDRQAPTCSRRDRRSLDT